MNTLVDRCDAEVTALHDHFVDWFTGAVPDSAHDRLERVLAPEFRRVTPAGDRQDRTSTLASVADGHGASPRDFRIETTAFEPRWSGEGACLGTYEEWQYGGEDGDNGRLSTVLFVRAEDAPGGVRWQHLHETWLAPPGSATDSSPGAE